MFYFLLNFMLKKFFIRILPDPKSPETWVLSQRVPEKFFWPTSPEVYGQPAATLYSTKKCNKHLFKILILPRDTVPQKRGGVGLLIERVF
jgi:hypothetical protein